jgi:DNA-binding NtrC family response regulator
MKAIANVDFSPLVPDLAETSCILIVDDEERIRAAYRQLLAAPGRSIEECSTGVEALSRLDHRDVDILILDLNLPDIHGLEVMEWMLSKHVPTAVVVFSGDESIDSAIRALRHGAFEFIRKHGSPQELIDTVDRLQRRRRIEREHALMTVRPRTIRASAPFPSSNSRRTSSILSTGTVVSFSSTVASKRCSATRAMNCSASTTR